MEMWLLLLMAAAGTAVSLYLWFRDVRQIMQSRKQTVDFAAGQVAAFRSRSARPTEDPDAAAVLARSEWIYRQALELYNWTRKKVWVWLPAVLMGFRAIPRY